MAHYLLNLEPGLVSAPEALGAVLKTAFRLRVPTLWTAVMGRYDVNEVGYDKLISAVPVFGFEPMEAW